MAHHDCDEKLSESWSFYSLWRLVQHEFHSLNHKLDNIMSAISDFKAKQDAHNAKIDAAVTGLTADIQALNDKITALQNTQGQITPEDQALLDEIDSRASAIADKLDALDSLTPPVVPTGTGTTSGPGA